MQNGSLKVVVDTNVYFMFFYNPTRKAGKLMRASAEGKIKIFSPDTVGVELKRLLMRELEYDENHAEYVISTLEVNWVDRQIYQNFIENAKILPHASDRPVLATALLLGCGIITANRKHFLPAQRMVKLWGIDELLAETEKSK